MENISAAVNTARPRPTASQLEWADCELGVLIHYDITIFEPGYSFREQWGYHPSPEIFNPRELDTDQWIKAAKAAGAKYAVLVAKHCTGFCLWPTEAHDFSVKSSPWRNGEGDIVGDFTKSCKKYGIKPGLYYSVSCNGYLNVDNPGRVNSGNEEEQRLYNEVVIKQVTELWTRYGELFEIWFDGGVMSPEEGGPDIEPLLLKYQPKAVCFQGPDSFAALLRWVGNEDGLAPEVCWSTTSLQRGNFAGDQKFPSVGVGDSEGSLWAPAEADMPNRKEQAFGGGWFWKAGEDHLLYSVDELVERYYASVGHNTNLLIGMAIDDRGLVPDADVEQLGKFGKEIERRFGKTLAQSSGQGSELVIELDNDAIINHICIMEDISQGEVIREFKVEGCKAGKWMLLCEGKSIGHKRIEKLKPVNVSKVRLIITKAVDIPRIKTFSVWKTQTIKEYKELVEEDLLENILPFWMNNAIDEENGGFIGLFVNQDYIDKTAPKGGVLCSRILWTYAHAYSLYKESKYLKMAQIAYDFMMKHFWDRDCSGVYWMVDYKGEVIDPRKQIYAEAFAIYGLSEYYKATGDIEALNKAIELYRLIEKHSYDSENGGYFEACTKEWGVPEDMRLSEKDMNEKKSMNTHLHVMEAYTNLLRVWEDQGLRTKLKDLVGVFTDHIIDKNTYHFKLFFDEKWNSKSLHASFGHDIEGSWLLHEAAVALGEDELLRYVKDISVKLALAVYQDGLDPEGGIYNEAASGVIIDRNKDWWPQAEAGIGFLNAFQLTGEERFLDEAFSCLDFINEYIIDKENGEWFQSVSADKKSHGRTKIDAWKCPYHNSRMCYELIARFEQLELC